MNRSCTKCDKNVAKKKAGTTFRSSTVNLPNGGHAKTGRFPWALRGNTQFGDLAPYDHRLGTKRSIVG
jgi:hypothetical protein